MRTRTRVPGTGVSPKTGLSPGKSPICTPEFIARCSRSWQVNSTGTLMWSPGSACARSPNKRYSEAGGHREGPAEEERGAQDKNRA